MYRGMCVSLARSYDRLHVVFVVVYWQYVLSKMELRSELALAIICIRKEPRKKSIRITQTRCQKRLTGST